MKGDIVRFRRFAFAAFALGVALSTAVPAAAKLVRFPGSGTPAWEVHVPDNWQVNKGKSENLMVFSPDAQVRVVVQILGDVDALDAFATAALKVAHAAPWKTKHAITISGFKGFDYPTTMGNSHGNKFNVDMMVVQIDAKHIAVCDLLVDAGAPRDQLNAGRQIVAATRIVK
ncbi:MAG: hypothetical protein JOZ72_04045 [Alphaproteobacteria bacterium]|nr:hypothetical protein [Alphaproteobacteria bacterium]